jgi:cyclopropane fatty-acyl-phospholipid synthase-like methyltransferase
MPTDPLDDPLLPHAPACDRNRDPILSVIGPLFEDCRTVLEIGSGTGQHAVYFAAQLPHLTWIASDLDECLPGIAAWIAAAKLPNVRGPMALDVARADWPAVRADAVFSANSAHIMGMPAVAAMFGGVGRLLPPGGLFVLYGPFNYGGAYTADSNARFDAWLKERDPVRGIRDFEHLDRLAGEAGMRLEMDVPMPANNRILCWQRADEPATSG